MKKNLYKQVLYYGLWFFFILLALILSHENDYVMLNHYPKVIDRLNITFLNPYSFNEYQMDSFALSLAIMTNFLYLLPLSIIFRMEGESKNYLQLIFSRLRTRKECIRWIIRKGIRESLEGVVVLFSMVFLSFGIIDLMNGQIQNFLSNFPAMSILLFILRLWFFFFGVVIFIVILNLYGKSEWGLIIATSSVTLLLVCCFVIPEISMINFLDHLFSSGIYLGIQLLIDIIMIAYVVRQMQRKDLGE